MNISEEQIKEAQDWIKVQLEEINPKESGLMILYYGTENYMVSSNTAKKLYKRMYDDIKKVYPKLMIMIVPFWLKVETIKDLEEFMNDENT